MRKRYLQKKTIRGRTRWLVVKTRMVNGKRRAAQAMCMSEGDG